MIIPHEDWFAVQSTIFTLSVLTTEPQFAAQSTIFTLSALTTHVLNF
jgi:hypothetical protein